jgi:hypothetical protein
MPLNFTPRKNRNQVRKIKISAIINHPLYVPIKNAGSKLAQNNAVLSRRIKILNTIVKKDRITINLLGGVHPPIFITILLVFFYF